MELTGEQLLGVFADYNLMIWPMQILAYLLGLIGLIFGIRINNLSNRVIPGILTFFWSWVALAFWLPSAQQGFSPGYLFAAVFLIQGGLFLSQLIKPKRMEGFHANFASWVGIIIMLYAMLGYPLFGYLIGHIYPRTPPFGLTPCPVVTYTFGMLLLTVQKVPKALLIIPLCYALSGILWVSIGVLEDIGMVLGVLIGVVLIWIRNSKTIYPTSEPSNVLPESGWSLDLTDKK